MKTFKKFLAIHALCYVVAVGEPCLAGTFFNMEEIWKKIKGYEGFYEVSNLGNVKSVERLIRFSDGRKRTFPSRVLAKNKSTNDYLFVALYVNQKFSIIGIHRLVAIAFIHNPENKPEVNHKDGNKANNHYLNLEWNTTRENSEHSFSNKLNKNFGENHTHSKLKNKDISEIKKMYSEGYFQREIALKYGVTRSLISYIVNNKTWQRQQKMG
jgi:hypothetical protein